MSDTITDQLIGFRSVDVPADGAQMMSLSLFVWAACGIAGLCASMASGIKAQFGTMAKPLNAGLAARTGVEAAQWAHSGMTAAHDGLAGPPGFGPTHHGQGADVELPQDAWRILSISHKFHACCHGLHAMLEALREADLNNSEVDKLHIHTHPRWMSVCNIPTPQTGLAAKFSYAQTAAMTLLEHDTGTIASFTDRITQAAFFSTTQIHYKAG